jgi:CRP-like cAMP-binding protein
MQDHSSLLASLNASWFAAGLEPETATRLAELARAYHAEPGQELFREGDQSELFGVVIRGRIALRTLVPERGPITILTIEPGDVFGWSTVVPPYRSTSSATRLQLLDLFVAEQVKTW